MLLGFLLVSLWFVYFCMLICGAILAEWVIDNVKPLALGAAISLMIIAVLCTDYLARQPHIDIIVPIAEKTLIPPAPGSAIYAFVVSRGADAWVLRVPKETFYQYEEGDMLRLQQARGPITGYTYSTTLHPSSYVHQ